jgi:hypothetical protein
MDPCPYRKEHEWEWEEARKGWLCRHCYAFTDKNDGRMDVRKPVADEFPTQPYPQVPTIKFVQSHNMSDVFNYFDLFRQVERLEARMALLELKFAKARIP